MFSNLSIKQKIVLPLSLMIVLLTLSSVLNVLTMWKQTELSDTLNEQVTPSLLPLKMRIATFIKRRQRFKV